jgi:hypothetical protein
MEPDRKAGRKTSVYLSAETDERVRQADIPLPELIRRGLDAIEPSPFESLIPDLETMLRRVLREELATLPLVAASQEQPKSARSHAQTCKCGTCQPKGNGR